MLVDPTTLRLLWNVVEETRSSDLLALTDTGLVTLLLHKISRKVLLSGEEVDWLDSYISSKTMLIRDIADSHRIRGTELKRNGAASASKPLF